MTALQGQTVVVIGGSAGIGLETARSARAEGAEVVLGGRDPDRLEQAAKEVGAQRYSTVDAMDPDQLDGFYATLPERVDHVMVTAGRPYYSMLADMDIPAAARHVADEIGMVLGVARRSSSVVRPGGALVLMGGTGARRPAPGLGLQAAMVRALPALTANLALELAPMRVNLVAAGFVDTPLSASLLGDDLDARREELRATLPVGRVIEAPDVAALAVHLMANTAVTGATYDIDGGQQLT
jgi:NAD(P)-dependent dehydrogenase (short-subunit alcohol dehydrogenase family)